MGKSHRSNLRHLVSDSQVTSQRTPNGLRGALRVVGGLWPPARCFCRSESWSNRHEFVKKKRRHATLAKVFLVSLWPFFFEPPRVFHQALFDSLAHWSEQDLATSAGEMLGFEDDDSMPQRRRSPKLASTTPIARSSCRAQGATNKQRKKPFGRSGNYHSINFLGVKTGTWWCSFRLPSTCWYDR